MSDDPVLAALARLEAGQTDVVTRLTGLEAGQTALRAEFLAELNKTRVELMARMDGHANQLTAIRDDISVNFGAVDHARLVNNNTRDEQRLLGDSVARMMTLILRLQTEVAELKGRP